MTGCVFLFKHNDLIIRVARATNIPIAPGYNCFKFGELFYAYRSLIEERSYSPYRLRDMYETGISNVQKPGH